MALSHRALHHGADAPPDALGGLRFRGPDRQQHDHDVLAGHGVDGHVVEPREHIVAHRGTSSFLPPRRASSSRRDVEPHLVIGDVSAWHRGASRKRWTTLASVRRDLPRGPSARAARLTRSGYALPPQARGAKLIWSMRVRRPQKQRWPRGYNPGKSRFTPSWGVVRRWINAGNLLWLLIK